MKLMLVILSVCGCSEVTRLGDGGHGGQGTRGQRSNMEGGGGRGEGHLLPPPPFSPSDFIAGSSSPPHHRSRAGIRFTPGCGTLPLKMWPCPPSGGLAPGLPLVYERGRPAPPRGLASVRVHVTGVGPEPLGLAVQAQEVLEARRAAHPRLPEAHRAREEELPLAGLHPALRGHADPARPAAGPHAARHEHPRLLAVQAADGHGDRRLVLVPLHLLDGPPGDWKMRGRVKG